MLEFKELKIQKGIARLNVLFYGTAQTLLLPLIPLIAKTTQLEISTLLFCISIGTLSFIPGTLFWARMADNGKIHKALGLNVFALLLSLLCLSLCLMSTLTPVASLIIFLSGRLIWGLGVSGIPVLTQYLQISHSGRTVKGLMENSFALNAGRLIGFSLALMPLELNTIFMTLSALVIVLLGLNLRFPQKFVSQTIPEKQFSSFSFIIPSVILALAITTTTGFIQAGLTTFIPESHLISKLLILGSVVMLLGLHFGRKARDTQWKSMLISGAILLVAGLVSFTFIESPAGLYVNMAIICLALSLVHPAPVMLMKHFTGNTVSTVSLGQLSAVNTLGSGLGGMIIAMKTDAFDSLAGGIALMFIIVLFKVFIVDLKKELAWGR